MNTLGVCALALGLLAGCSSRLPPLQSSPGREAPVANAIAVHVPAAKPAPVAVAAKPTVDIIYFDSDVYLVAPEYRPLLERHALRLRGDPKRRLVVHAHADAEGPADYNRALSEKRAETVVKLLRSLGVDERQVELRAHGKQRPAAAGTDAAALAKSRRVELVAR